LGEKPFEITFRKTMGLHHVPDKTLDRIRVGVIARCSVRIAIR